MNSEDTRNCALTAEEKMRYARHLLLPEVGEAGQARLRAAKVLMIGVGGLGAPAVLYLAAAGIGMMGLVDDDKVELSNLQRQVLFTTQDVGRYKVDAAQEKIRQLNPHVLCEVVCERFSATNALKLIADYDVIVDGTDNFSAHYAINDACVLSGKPLISASVLKFEGQLLTVIPHEGPCYRCIYPHPPQPGSVLSCAEIGVMGAVPGLLGVMQASEVLKLVLGIGKGVMGRILVVDVLNSEYRSLALSRNQDCPVCGERPVITKLVENDCRCGRATEEVSAEELKALLGSRNAPMLLDVREQEEFDQRHIDGAVLVPLPSLEERCGELDRSQEIVVYCRTGRRSAEAIALLKKRGFEKLRNLKGGIMSFS